MQTRQAEKFVNSNRHYSLRKLSVGLASVLIGISFLNGTKTTVKADTIAASTKTGEVSKADNLEVAGDSKDLSAFSMHFNRKNGENETAKADTTSDQTMQTGDQAEAKNQENRLVDQINYKLTKNDSADSKEDLGQNLTVPDETKQVPTTKSDPEKSITQTSSDQHVNNQLNNRAEGDSQAQPQNSKKLDLTKNSKKFAKKVLATNLIATPPMTNGGFDEATWGKLDVNDWQGSVQNGVYQLTHYSGDLSHVIVPNEADFEKAGKSTNGLQVGISSDTIKSFFTNLDKTFAFSKTNSQKVKAIGADWSATFAYRFTLSKFDGSNLDVSNVTNMRSMFSNSKISNLNSLTNWDVSNVTNMSSMFGGNQISDLTPLANWKTSKVTDMNRMFVYNKVSDLTPLTYWDTSNVTDMSSMFGGGGFNHNSISDLAPLANWKTGNVTDMSGMFDSNRISNLTPLDNWDTSNVTNMRDMFSGNKISDLTSLKNWDTSKVTDMSKMFAGNSISDLTPLANWDISKVANMSEMFAGNPDLINLKPIANWNISSAKPWGFSGIFKDDTKLDLTNINNTPLMQNFLKKPIMLQGSTFIINNIDFVAKLVKATTGKDVPILTNTAKRTIVFNFPNGTHETVNQTINYKAVAPVQVNFPVPTGGRIEIMALAFASERQPFVSERPPFAGERPPFAGERPPFASVRQPVQSDGPKIIKTYPVKESDWQLDTSKPNDDVIIDGVICFKPVQIPRIDGYKAYIVKDPVNPAMFLVSFFAVPGQLQNNQSNNVQLPQKPVQPEQKQPEQKQPEQKPAQPIQTRPADDKQVDQVINHISYVLMHSDSTFDDVNSFEPAQGDSAQLEASSDSTQKDDTTKIVNAAKLKKHIVKKHVVKRHKKHAKKYHLKRRSRKHTKRSRHAKKRMIKHRKSVSRKFRKYSLKHIKKA